MGGCFPLAPYAGRVRQGEFDFLNRHVRLPVTLGEHAIHGLVHDRPWRVTSPTTLSRVLDSRWPFGGEVTQEFALDDTSLSMRLDYRAGAEATPATLGFHPWFPRHMGAAQVARASFVAEAKYLRGPDGLPTGGLGPVGNGPWDDCFTAPQWPVVLTWPNACRLTISSDADHLVVFDELESAICIEPQTGPPNEVNLSNRRTLSPGESFSVGMTWEWSDLSPGYGPLR